MAEIVLVHGIDHEQKGARVLESVWLPAIADGLTKIGREDLASGVWDRGKAGVRDVRMAFYGDLFLSAEGEGLTRAERQEIERKNEIRDHALAIQVLANAASRSEDPGQRTVAAEELDRLRANPPESMGAAAAARSVTHALLRLRYFERAAMTVLEALKPPVRQMSRYFNETSLRRDILNRVGAHVDEKTKVVIGHSLGCVVAYEALWELADSRSRNNVDLLLTAVLRWGFRPFTTGFVAGRTDRRPGSGAG